MDTKTVELNRGYVDTDGNNHCDVTLRPPTLHDEIEVEKRCRELGWDADGTGGQTVLLHRCITHWEGLPDHKLKHLTSLRRPDARKLVTALVELENGTEDGEMGNGGSSTEDTPSP